MYMHQYMNLCPPDCPCLLHPLCIVWWKPGCPCVGLWFCLNHPTSTPTPCLECVHVYMSTWFLLSAAPLLHSYIIHRLISWAVTSNPLTLMLPLGFTHDKASATATFLPGMYLLVKLYGWSFNKSLCSLAGASLKCFRWMSSRGL